MDDSDTPTEKDLQARRALDPQLLAARLEVARIRKFPGQPIAVAVHKMMEKYGVGRRAYYNHEDPNSPKKPGMKTLHMYADVFDTPLDYFLYGKGGQQFEAEAREIARRFQKSLMIDFAGDAETGNVISINQATQQIESNASHNSSIRSIVLLTAGDIKKISTGRGDLAQMSGQALPAPGYIDTSPESFWYIIPQHDFSMVGGDNVSLPPGTHVLVDLDREIAPIDPGKMVLAQIEGRDEPVIRRYIAERSYTPGVKFKLEAFNPLSDPIMVDDPAQCTLIGRIVFYGFRG